MSRPQSQGQIGFDWLCFSARPPFTGQKRCKLALFCTKEHTATTHSGNGLKSLNQSSHFRNLLLRVSCLVELLNLLHQPGTCIFQNPVYTLQLVVLLTVLHREKLDLVV